MHESVAAIAATGVSPLVRIAANQGWMVKRTWAIARQELNHADRRFRKGHLILVVLAQKPVILRPPIYMC